MTEQTERERDLNLLRAAEALAKELRRKLGLGPPRSDTRAHSALQSARDYGKLTNQ